MEKVAKNKALAKRTRKFPGKSKKNNNKKQFKDTGAVPRCPCPVFHWLISCYNNELKSINLRRVASEFDLDQSEASHRKCRQGLALKVKIY